MRPLALLRLVGLLAWTAALAVPAGAAFHPPDNTEAASSGPPESNAAGENAPAGPSAGSEADSAAPPSTPPPRQQSWSHPRPGNVADAAEPLQRSWVDFSAIQPGLFPGIRHHVRRWTSPTVSWVSPNSPSSIIPEPPTQGPVACGCPAPTSDGVQPADVYGQMERDRLWTWCAVFFDAPGETTPEQTHFIPDIWAGRRPCRALNRRGILHRFPHDRVVQDAAGRYFIHPDVQRTMDAQAALDDGLIGQIWADEAARKDAEIPGLDRRVAAGATSPEELRELWAVWVQTLLVRRGYILHDLLIFTSYRWLEAADPAAWQKVIEDEHFGPAPLGVWFENTLFYAPQIRYYITLGVPVYYRWDVRFFSEAKLADLRPRDPPTNAELGLPNPPMSPHRSATRRAQALWQHDHSKRPKPAPRVPDDPFADSGPEVLDEKDFNSLIDRMTEIESSWQLQCRHLAAQNGTQLEQGQRRDSHDGPAGAPSSPTDRITAPRPALLDRMSSVPPPLSLLSRFDAGSGPAGSSRGPTAESRARMITTVAATPDGVHQEGFQDRWRFAVTTDTPASRSFLDMLNSGQLPTHQERIGFSFTTGMPFATPVPRQPRAFDIAQSWMLHAVRDDWFITPSMTPAEQYARWRESATHVLARPHARAALLPGGLLARIAIHLGLDLSHALRGPLDDARMNGTPFPMENADGAELWDDYLSTDEMAILVGQVGVGGTLTLFPRQETFATFWWADGAWTEEHERWFVARLRELDTTTQPAGRSRDGWRSALKRNQRYPQS